MFEKRHHKYQLSVEQGTDAVPDDGQYHVVVNGEIVLSTRVFELARITYEEQREDLRIAKGDPDPKEMLRREIASREVREIRADSVGHTSYKRRGGPGGRGGI